MFQAIESYLIKRWYSEQPIWFLLPLSWLVAGFATFKRKRFIAQRMMRYKSKCPLIIIGNITVGGTGKTPVVIFLVNELKKNGFQPAVISRGYGTFAHSNRLVDSSHSASLVGDEPLLIHNHTGVPVAVGKDRIASIKLIHSQHPEVDVIISDDGLQHYKIERTLEVVVVDAKRGLGNSHSLPAGPLREPKSRLTSVDAILFNQNLKNDDSICTSFPDVAVSQYGFSLHGSILVNLKTKERKELCAFNSGNREIIAVAGIGHPERFFSLLTDYGLQFDKEIPGDHQRVSDTFFLEHQDKKNILMTEKDAVKYKHLECSNVWYLPVEVLLDDVSEKSFLSMVLNRLNEF